MILLQHFRMDLFSADIIVYMQCHQRTDRFEFTTHTLNDDTIITAHQTMAN